MTPLRSTPAWRVLAGAFAVVGCVAYALVAHHAASAPEPGLLEAAVFIVPLMGFALLLAWRSAHRAAWLAVWLAAVAGLWLARGQLAASTHWVLLLQHVGMNTMLGLVFGRTLAPGATPLVSRFARVVHGTLSPLLTRYTRQVTWAWVVFFGLTAGVSVLLFAFAPLAIWSAFVNLLSLPLLGAMFVGEYAVRLWVIPRAERSGFLQAIGSWRQFDRNKAGKPHSP